jgi:hypothetical protein
MLVERFWEAVYRFVIKGLKPLWGYVWVASCFAQGFPAMDGVVVTDSGVLDIESINQSARMLENLNVKPFVLFMEAEVGLSLDEASAYFDAVLENYGLLNNGIARSNLFALFVGTNPLPLSANQRPIYIAYGPDLVTTLESMAGSKSVDEFIRNDLMIPKLRDGSFTRAFTSTFESLAERLDTARSSTQVQTPSPSTQGEADRFEWFKNYAWLGLPILALLGVLGLRRRSKVRNKTTLEPEPNLRDIQDEIQKSLHELESSLPADATKQTEMILLSEFMKVDHLEEWQKLNRGYEQAVRNRDDVAQKMQIYRLNNSSVSQTLETYSALQKTILEVKVFVQSLNDKWLILNREVLAIPDRITALKGSIQQLRIGYKEREEFLSADEVFKPLEQDLSELESLHQANQSLRALKLLNQTQNNVTLVNESMTRLMNADKRLDDFERFLPEYQQQGFKLFRFSERIQNVRSQFAIALGLVKQGEYKVLDAQVDEVEELVSEVVDASKQFMDLYKTNQQRLDELKAMGEEVKWLIEQASQTFDKVNDFAPSTWRDIEGYGSEAQALANMAEDLYQQALDANELEGPQNFQAAKECIDQGFEELSKARHLVEALEDRLKCLTEAQQIAKAQLLLVEQDLQKHRSFLRQPSVDSDVGSLPEEKFSQAENVVAKINLELSLPQPDWLKVMELIQAADRLTDEAFEAVRSEQEAMEHRRLRVQSEKVEASAALQRVKNYCQTHMHRLGSHIQTGISDAETLFLQAEDFERQAQDLSEALRAQTLEQAAATFDQAEQKATVMFSNAEQEVQRVLQQEADTRRQQMQALERQRQREREREQSRSSGNSWWGSSDSSSSSRSYTTRSSSSSRSSRSSSSSSSSRSGSWGGGGRKSGGGW